MGKIFKRGLFAIAPLALTLCLVLWFFGTVEDIFSVPIKALIGTYYFRGLGILVALILIFLIGTIINNYIIQKLSQLGEKILTKIPLVKTLYNSLGEMMSYFGSKQENKQGQVVCVQIGGVRMIGLVTRDSFEDLPDFANTDQIAVFVPMSYQIGGYTILVPKASVSKLSMTVEEGMRFAVTAGVLSQSKK